MIEFFNDFFSPEEQKQILELLESVIWSISSKIPTKEEYK